MAIIFIITILLSFFIGAIVGYLLYQIYNEKKADVDFKVKGDDNDVGNFMDDIRNSKDLGAKMLNYNAKKQKAQIYSDEPFEELDVYAPSDSDWNNYTIDDLIDETKENNTNSLEPAYKAQEINDKLVKMNLNQCFSNVVIKNNIQKILADIILSAKETVKSEKIKANMAVNMNHNNIGEDDKKSCVIVVESILTDNDDICTIKDEMLSIDELIDIKNDCNNSFDVVPNTETKNSNINNNTQKNKNTDISFDDSDLVIKDTCYDNEPDLDDFHYDTSDVIENLGSVQNIVESKDESNNTTNIQDDNQIQVKKKKKKRHRKKHHQQNIMNQTGTTCSTLLEPIEVSKNEPQEASESSIDNYIQDTVEPDNDAYNEFPDNIKAENKDKVENNLPVDDSCKNNEDEPKESIKRGRGRPPKIKKTADV